jgi:chromate transport protein ChrA
VIGALGVFVGRNALIDHGRPDWLPIALAIGAFAALWRFKVGAIWVIAACALVGLGAAGIGW